MRILYIIIAALLVSFTANTTKDYLNLETPLEYNDTEFYLAWSDQPRHNYYVQEYLPEGEKLENFNQMMHMNLFLTDLSVKETVQVKIKELKERKKTDGVCNFEVNISPDKKEMIVDFMLSESEGGYTKIVEFNIYHYSKVEINGEEAIAMFAYSRRGYGDDIKEFFADLKQNRIKYLKEMIELDKPEINLEEE